jgi:hypothetical protein
MTCPGTVRCDSSVRPLSGLSLMWRVVLQRFTRPSVQMKLLKNKELITAPRLDPAGWIRMSLLLLPCIFASLLPAGCSGGSSSSSPGPGSGQVAHSVILNWDASSTPTVVGYNVFRSTQSGGPYTALNTGLVSGLTYTDQTVQPGKTYYYNLTAVDGNGVESQFAGEVSAVIPSP